MPEMPDPPAERDAVVPGPDEHDAPGDESLDVAEWVSELRRLYVEPKTRAELREEGAMAPLRRKLRLRGPRRAREFEEIEPESGHLSPMRPSPVFVQGLPHPHPPGSDPAAPTADSASGPGSSAPEVPSEPTRAVAASADEPVSMLGNLAAGIPTRREPTSAAPVVAPRAAETEDRSSGGWLLSYLEATGRASTADDAGSAAASGRDPAGADLAADDAVADGGPELEAPTDHVEVRDEPGPEVDGEPEDDPGPGLVGDPWPVPEPLEESRFEPALVERAELEGEHESSFVDEVLLVDSAEAESGWERGVAARAGSRAGERQRRRAWVCTRR